MGEDYPFGDLLRGFRQRARMSQQALANSLGKHRNTIRMWERGDYLPDTSTDVLEIARALTLSPPDQTRLLHAYAGTENHGVQHVGLAVGSHTRREELPLIGADTPPVPSSLPISSDSSQNVAISVDIPRSETQTRKASEQRNRARMLKRVRAFWIKGVLEQSLHHAPLVTLGLHEQRDAVAYPWNLVIQQAKQPACSLPTSTCITELYHETDGDLLILGEPGAGKTTLLLELARDLLDSADQDPTHPIPVVFTLSSWAVKQQSFATWLVEELNLKYQVPRKVGQAWIDSDEILPLLDGLDEVAEQERLTCIEAINAYRHEHAVPLVVCSRRAEYKAQVARLALQRAVLILPLSAQQIDDYLSCADQPLQAIREALRTDRELQNVIQTPLMLNIVSLAYQGRPARDLQAKETPETLRQEVFATYVQRMLQRHRGQTRYTSEQTMHWLIWLAQQMRRHSQTDFYIEQLQIDWFSDHFFYQFLFSLSTGLLIAFFGWIVYGIFFWNKFGPIGVFRDAVFLSLFFVLVYILINNVLFPLLEKQKKILRATKRKVRLRSWRRLLGFLIDTLRTRWCYGVLIGVPVGALVGFLMGQTVGLPSGLVYGLFNILMLTIGFVIFDKFSIEIKPVEIVVWSWTSVWRNLGASSLSALGFGLFMGTLFYVDPQFSLKQAILIGFFYGVGALTISNGIHWGLSQEILEKQDSDRPNQAIRRSAKNCLLFGTLGGLSGLLFWLIFIFMGRPTQGLYYGALVGVGVGGIAALRQGGFACFQHYFVRILLRSAGSIPWTYAKFLDYAVEHTLLRKVGGGYIFVHRLLLDYFFSLTLEENERTNKNKEITR